MKGVMSHIGTNLPIWGIRSPVTSLIGRSGSSAFRLFTTPVSMSLACGRDHHRHRFGRIVLRERHLLRPRRPRLPPI
jgi:hypothetical protein